MKKKIFTLIFSSIIFSIFLAKGGAVTNIDLIEKIKISEKEVPDGFTYGKKPGFARNVLKDNPWNLDKKAIKKMANRIYPDGDYNNITDIHMTIMAKKNNPFRDDIICYVIILKNGQQGKNELKKITSYAGYNRDRIILLTKDNIVICLLVDDIDNFEYIKSISMSMKSRLEEI
jgi:hypothetical protein